MDIDTIMDNTASWKGKVKVAHDAITACLNKSRGKQPCDINDYGDARFALGFLTALAVDEAEKKDKE